MSIIDRVSEHLGTFARDRAMDPPVLVDETLWALSITDGERELVLTLTKLDALQMVSVAIEVGQVSEEQRGHYALALCGLNLMGIKTSGAAYGMNVATGQLYVQDQLYDPELSYAGFEQCLSRVVQAARDLARRLDPVGASEAG